MTIAHKTMYTSNFLKIYDRNSSHFICTTSVTVFPDAYHSSGAMDENAGTFATCLIRTNSFVTSNTWSISVNQQQKNTKCFFFLFHYIWYNFSICAINEEILRLTSHIIPLAVDDSGTVIGISLIKMPIILHDIKQLKNRNHEIIILT